LPIIKVLVEYVCEDYDQHIKSSIGLESRQFTPSKERYLSIIEREAESMFKDKSKISLEELLEFKKEMMR
jgi:hypothetical protein